MSGQGSAPGLGGVGLSSAGRGGKARRRFTPKTPKVAPGGAAAAASPAAGPSSSSAARSESNSRKSRDRKPARGGRGGRGRGGPGGGRGGRGRGGSSRGRVALPFGRVAFAAGGSGSGTERGPSAVLTAGLKGRSGGGVAEEGDGDADLAGDIGADAPEDDEEDDSWPPVFVPGDAARPVTLPFYRLDQDAEISGGTELLAEARQQQAAASAQVSDKSGKASTADKPTISKAMRKLPVAPRVASEQFSDPSICMDSFLGGSSGQLPKLFLMQLPTRLPLQPELRSDAGGGSSSSSSSSAAAASAAFGGPKAARASTEPPSFSHAATLAFSASSNPELTTDQRAAVRIKAAAEYAEATADPQGSAAALRAIGGGRIGEVLLYRSGKCVLKIGDALFDLSKGINNRQLQQAVQIKGAQTVDWRLPGVALSPEELAEPGAKKKSGSSSSSSSAGAAAAKADDPSAAGASFVPLGDIDHKLIATPQPETLARILVHGARSAAQDASEDDLSDEDQDAAGAEASAAGTGDASDVSDSEPA